MVCLLLIHLPLVILAYFSTRQLLIKNKQDADMLTIVLVFAPVFNIMLIIIALFIFLAELEGKKLNKFFFLK
jgi:hypothetical protein